MPLARSLSRAGEKYRTMERRLTIRVIEELPDTHRDGRLLLLFGGSYDEAANFDNVPDADSVLLTAPAVAVWRQHTPETGDAGGWLVTRYDSGVCGIYYDNPSHWAELPHHVI